VIQSQLQSQQLSRKIQDTLLTYYNLCIKEYWILATTFDLVYVDPEDKGSQLLLNADKWSDIPELSQHCCENLKVSYSRYLKNLTLN
jgi:hypothetical protein